MAVPPGAAPIDLDRLKRTTLARPKRAPLPADPVTADIESLTHEGRGLARVEGKAVFIDGALAGERVRFRYSRLQRTSTKARWWRGWRPHPSGWSRAALILASVAGAVSNIRTRRRRSP